MKVTEELVARRFIDAGYDVFTTGWPDLFVGKNGKFVAYEIKGPGDTLRPAQLLMHDALRASGIVVEIIDEQSLPWLGPTRASPKPRLPLKFKEVP